MTGHPMHVPTFQASRFLVGTGSAPPAAAYPDFKAAWSLDKCVLRVYPLAEPPTDYTRPTMTLKRPQSLVTPPNDNGQSELWHGTEWLANLRAAMPEAALRPDWATAPVVQARIDLTGGEIEGMEPPEGPMKNAIWSFGQAPEQILTSRFVYRLKGSNGGFEARLSDASGHRFIYLDSRKDFEGGNVVASIYHNPMIEPLEANGATNGDHSHDHTHGAPPSRRQGPVVNSGDRLPNMTHASAFYELLANPPSADRPIPMFQKFVGSTPTGETISCVPSVFVS